MDDGFANLVSRHARPHLQTHTRSDGHSAVAGAAYRLGLKLFDERARVWHDFRIRALGEEIVRAITVAPKGAPSWRDRAILWNRVELSEKRKDAQVARDYRVPIPFGLTDRQAGDLAEEMATFIAEELHTPVSVGLHRDAAVDVLGVIKPSDKQGFHAHLYFPTRKICDAGEDGDEESGGAASMKYGFGSKLSLLSNKTTSAMFVEDLNAKWALLANRYCLSQELTANFDHRSYKRQGLNLRPEITMGRHATAMERKGISTYRGAALKEARVMAQVFERAGQHAAIPGQHRQAVIDRLRERRNDGSDSSVPKIQTSLQSLPLIRRPTAASTLLTGSPRHRPKPRTKFLQSTTRKNTLSGDSLAIQLLGAGPSPQTDAEQQALDRAIGQVDLIESILLAASTQMKEVDQFEESMERAKAHRLDSQHRADVSREHRSVACVRASKWDAEHPWKAKLALVSGSTHPEQQRLQQQIHFHNRHVQELKRTAKAQEAIVLDVGRDLAEAKAQIVEQKSRLRKALKDLLEYDSRLLQRLIAALPKPLRDWVRSIIEPARARKLEVIDESDSQGQEGGAKTAVQMTLSPHAKAVQKAMYEASRLDQRPGRHKL